MRRVILHNTMIDMIGYAVFSVTRIQTKLEHVIASRVDVQYAWNRSRAHRVILSRKKKGAQLMLFVRRLFRSSGKVIVFGEN